MNEPGGEELGLHFLELERVLDRISHSSTHYQVLGVERSAKSDEIGAAHKQVMSLLKPSDLRYASLHSSMASSIEEAAEKAVLAYMVLNNFGSRVEYDNSLVHRATVPIPFNLSQDPPKRSAPEQAIHSRVETQTTIQSKPEAPAPVAVTPSMPVGQPAPAITANSTGGSADTIDIKRSSARVLFTKPADEPGKAGNKRKYQRLKLSIPTYVTGYDRIKGKWTEIAHTLDVSIGGVAIETVREMPEGAVVHLTIPMPTKLRRHGYSDPTYQVYAIVRRVEARDEEHTVLGLEFLGQSPPAGFLQTPWARFQTRF